MVQKREAGWELMPTLRRSTYLKSMTHAPTVHTQPTTWMPLVFMQEGRPTAHTVKYVINNVLEVFTLSLLLQTY